MNSADILADLRARIGRHRGGIRVLPRVRLAGSLLRQRQRHRTPGARVPGALRRGAHRLRRLSDRIRRPPRGHPGGTVPRVHPGDRRRCTPRAGCRAARPRAASHQLADGRQPERLDSSARAADGSLPHRRSPQDASRMSEGLRSLREARLSARTGWNQNRISRLILTMKARFVSAVNRPGDSPVRLTLPTPHGDIERVPVEENPHFGLLRRRRPLLWVVLNKIRDGRSVRVDLLIEPTVDAQRHLYPNRADGGTPGRTSREITSEAVGAAGPSKENGTAVDPAGTGAGAEVDC